MKIKSSIKKLLKKANLYHERFNIEIVKKSVETFDKTKYKGTDVDKIREVVHVDHPETRIGKLEFGKHISIRNTIILDLVGDITIGDYCIFSDNVAIMTHDHQIKEKIIILANDETKGVNWSSIEIGEDVYFGMNSIITKNVTKIPRGVVIGAGSVLTKNPSEYEIWAGVPARKIGERK